MPKIVRMTLTLGLLMVCLVLLAHADTVPIEATHDEGFQIGMTIDQHNWQVAEHVLPPEILRPLQAGEFAITVQETTDFPLRQAYVAATEMNATRVTLDGGTRITNYPIMLGAPFPYWRQPIHAEEKKRRGTFAIATCLKRWNYV